MERSITNLFVWDEIRKIKKTEKVKVQEQMDMQKSQQAMHYVNPESRKILFMKRAQSYAQLEEPNFDNHLRTSLSPSQRQTSVQDDGNLDIQDLYALQSI
jgi:hypothetical protein